MKIDDKLWKWTANTILNRLTEDPDDCYAEVKIRNVYTLRDLSKLVAAKNAGMHPDTVYSIAQQLDEAKVEAILDGNSVTDSIIKISPRITGSFKNSKAAFDPAVNKRTVDITISADFKAQLEKVKVEMEGLRAQGAEIASIDDMESDKTDGTITIGGFVIIAGDKLKVDEEDAEQGVFFIAEDGTAHKSAKLKVNKPSQLIAKVPTDLAESSCRLVIRTKYTGNQKPLATMREIEFAKMCTAVKE